jgi:hypothetical protein
LPLRPCSKLKGGSSIRKRNITIGLRFTPDELQELNSKAARAGMLRGEFVRRAVHGAVFREAPPVEYAELIRQLKYVGTLLDNLLKHAANDSPEAGEIRDALAYNSEVEQRVWDAFAPDN